MHLLTYSMEQRVLLEKLTGLQLVKKFPAFYGTRRFITALTSARHLSLSWASSIQSTQLHPTSRRSILILSSYLRLGLPSGLLPKKEYIYIYIYIYFKYCLLTIRLDDTSVYNLICCLEKYIETKINKPWTERHTTSSTQPTKNI